jgi:hypothetical protein
MAYEMKHCFFYSGLKNGYKYSNAILKLLSWYFVISVAVDLGEVVEGARALEPEWEPHHRLLQAVPHRLNQHHHQLSFNKNLTQFMGLRPFFKEKGHPFQEVENSLAFSRS